MSLFEKIKNKRYDLQEIQKKQMSGGSNSSSNNNTKTQNQQKNIEKKFGPGKEETKSDKAYTDYVKKKAKDLKTTPAELERSVDRGIRAVDRPTGGRMPSKGYASGEPFQPDNNPRDPKGKYPATGKSTLRGRMKYGLDTKASGGDTLPAVKKRLAKRIGYAIKGTREEPRFKTKDDISKFVDKVTKNQPPLSKATGKKSTLYKTLKSYTDAKNPTVQGGGKPARFVKGKDGVVRQYGGGKLPMPEGPKRDAAIKKNLENLDKKIVKAAKLPKGVKLPVGGTRTSAPLDPKEFNLQFKADKLKLDYGGRFSERDGLTAAERKRKLKKIQTDLNIKNPTITSPKTGGRLPATATNLKKFNLPPLTKTKSFKTPPLSKPLYQKSGIISPKKIKMGTPLRNRFKSRSAVGTTLALAGAAYLLTKGNKPKPKNNNNKPIILPPGQKIISTGQSGVKFNLAGPGGGRLKLPNASDPSK